MTAHAIRALVLDETFIARVHRLREHVVALRDSLATDSIYFSAERTVLDTTPAYAVPYLSFRVGHLGYVPPPPTFWEAHHAAILLAMIAVGVVVVLFADRRAAIGRTDDVSPHEEGWRVE